jgi:hypothetical protein
MRNSCMIPVNFLQSKECLVVHGMCNSCHLYSTVVVISDGTSSKYHSIEYMRKILSSLKKMHVFSVISHEHLALLVH